MAVTLVSNTAGADPAQVNRRLKQLRAQNQLIAAEVLGKGWYRAIVTTTDATPGSFQAVTSLNDQSGNPIAFDANTVRVIKVKALGKTVGATTNVEYFEQAIVVLGGATPTVISGTGKSFDVDNNSVAGSVTATAGVGTLTLNMTGKLASAITWIIDYSVSDAIPVT